MEKLTTDLNPKTIPGKKIRGQSLESVLLFYIIIPIFAVFDTLTGVGADWKRMLWVTLISWALLSPLLIITLLHKFCFGKILAVLTEDKLYFFNAEATVNKKHIPCTDGYVYYSAIKDVRHYSSRRHSHTAISGNGFEISVAGTGRFLAPQIKKMQAADPGFAHSDPDTFFTAPTPAPAALSGLFAEVWQAFEKYEIADWFDGETTDIEEIYSHEDIIEIIAHQNGAPIYISIDPEELCITVDQSTNIIPIKDIPDLPTLISLIRESLDADAR